MVQDSYEASTRVGASLAASLASPRLRPGRASRTRRAPTRTRTRTRTRTAPAPHPHRTRTGTRCDLPLRRRARQP
eukprot:scaffold103079_cov59-Phaeocystis_antarctica.AAC.1